MKRKFLTLSESQKCLDPYYSKIATAVLEGFNDYLKIASCTVDKVGFIEYKTRTKANMIHDCITMRVKQSFNDEIEIEVGEWNGIFGIKINEDLFIRFKKLNEDYSPSSAATKQSKKYLNQHPIDGLPEEPMFLFAGYTPDKTWTKITGIYIACWNGEQSQWVEEILSKVSYEQIRLPFDNTEEEVENNKNRVKIKIKNQSDNNKTGTND